MAQSGSGQPPAFDDGRGGSRRPATQGIVTLVIGVAAVAALLAAAAYTAHSLVLVMIAAAVAAIVILHFWNKRPVKRPGDDVRLNLDK